MRLLAITIDLAWKIKSQLIFSSKSQQITWQVVDLDR